MHGEAAYKHTKDRSRKMSFASMPNNGIRWRASGVYVSTLSSKTSLIDETKIFLRVFSQTGDLAATCQALIEGELSQGSRQTRIAIVKVLRVRLPRSYVTASLARKGSREYSIG